MYVDDVSADDQRDLEKRDSKGWSTVIITAMGSWDTTVPRGHRVKNKTM